MLINALRARSSETQLLRAPARVLSVASALGTVAGLRSHLREANGRRAAIWCRDPGNFLLSLLALHGSADELLLIPADTASELAQEFVRRAATEWVVCDHHAANLSGCTVVPFATMADGRAQGSPGATRDTAWILTTSGTTGTPKLVRHTLATLAATTRREGSEGAAFCWGLVYDPARFAGLQVVLQALLGGSSLAAAPLAESFDERLSLFADAGVNALSATPTLWRKLLMSGKGGCIDLRIATLGGEVADQRILDAVQAAYPRARVRHVYAATEAGVGFSVTDRVEGFPATWLSTPPPGIELRVGQLAATECGEGELYVRSPRTARVGQDGMPLLDVDGWLGTGDLVGSDGARVRFLGRMNGAINVGGDKVYPETVEGVLTVHEAVFAASVRAKKNAFTGSLVEAAIVLNEGHQPDPFVRASILDHCRARLPKYAVPALLRFVADVDSNSTGKQDRRA